MAFDESQHPRDEGGQFSSTGGGSGELPDFSAARADVEKNYPTASGEVSGLEVGEHVANQDSIASSLNDYTILPGIREVRVGSFEQSGPPTFASASEERRTRALADEIKRSGKIDPLIVVDDGQASPYVLEGGHRFDALKILGVQSFPAMVVVDEEGFRPKGGATKMSGTIAKLGKAEIQQRGDQFCVVDDTGEPLPGGCYATRGEAEQHLQTKDDAPPEGLPERASLIWKSMYDSAFREWRGSNEQKRAVARSAADAAIRARFQHGKGGDWTERSVTSVESFGKPVRGHYQRVVGCKFVTDPSSAKRRVSFSEVYVPWDVDAHGDFTDEGEIESGAYRYAHRIHEVPEFAIGQQHRDWLNKGVPVETFLTRPGDRDFPVPGSWVMGIEWSKPMWSKIESGEVTGLSMGGDWARIPVVIGQRVSGAKAEAVRARAIDLAYLKDIDVEEVSGVDSPANRKRFRFFKGENAMAKKDEQPQAKEAVTFDQCVAAVDASLGDGMGFQVCSIMQAKYGAPGSGITIPDGMTLEQAAAECAQQSEAAGILKAAPAPMNQEQQGFVKALERIVEKAVAPIRAILAPPCPDKAKDALSDCVSEKMADASFRDEFDTEEQALAVAYSKCGEKSNGAGEEEPMTKEEQERFAALEKAVAEIKAAITGAPKADTPAPPVAPTVPVAANVVPIVPAAKDSVQPTAPVAPVAPVVEDEDAYVPKSLEEVGEGMLEMATTLEGIKAALGIEDDEEFEDEPAPRAPRPGVSRQVVEPEPAETKEEVGEDEPVFSSIVGANISRNARTSLRRATDRRMQEKYGDRRGSQKNTSGLGMRVAKSAKNARG